MTRIHENNSRTFSGIDSLPNTILANTNDLIINYGENKEQYTLRMPTVLLISSRARFLATMAPEIVD